jgi:predicted nuclease of predicted toxin-antitoxin system
MYHGLKEYFEEKGWVVKTVDDLNCKSANDKEVRVYAKEHDMILVTQDKRSANVASRNGIKVVLVTIGDISDLVISRIKEKYSNIF